MIVDEKKYSDENCDSEFDEFLEICYKKKITKTKYRRICELIDYLSNRDNTDSNYIMFSGLVTTERYILSDLVFEKGVDIGEPYLQDDLIGFCQMNDIKKINYYLDKGIQFDFDKNRDEISSEMFNYILLYSRKRKVQKLMFNITEKKNNKK